MNGNLRDRPEAPWALWSGIAGALAVAGLLLKGSFAAPGLSAVIGVLAVPLVAALAAIPLGIWGAAVGHVTLRLRGRLRGPGTVLVMSFVLRRCAGHRAGQCGRGHHDHSSESHNTPRSDSKTAQKTHSLARGQAVVAGGAEPRKHGRQEGFTRRSL